VCHRYYNGGRKLPNANQQPTIPIRRSVLTLAPTGAGKTTQFATLPGRKFLYIFDPNSILSLSGQDIDYEEFLPDRLPLSVSSLSKGKGDRSETQGSRVYMRWEAHFEKWMNTKQFEQYDWLGIDSVTTFLDLIMDRVLAINGRAGMWPMQDDYGPQMNSFANVIRTCTSLPINFYATGHVEYRQDDMTKRIFQTPLMTGRLKVKIPLLFSEILYLSAETDQKGITQYVVQTRPDRMTPLIRCTQRNLEFKEDITLDWNVPLPGQGLGRLFGLPKPQSSAA
jgi:hypothetical protein